MSIPLYWYDFFLCAVLRKEKMKAKKKKKIEQKAWIFHH